MKGLGSLISQVQHPRKYQRKKSAGPISNSPEDVEAFFSDDMDITPTKKGSNSSRSKANPKESVPRSPSILNFFSSSSSFVPQATSTPGHVNYTKLHRVEQVKVKEEQVLIDGVPRAVLNLLDDDDEAPNAPNQLSSPQSYTTTSTSLSASLTMSYSLSTDITPSPSPSIPRPKAKMIFVDDDFDTPNEDLVKASLQLKTPKLERSQVAETPTFAHRSFEFPIASSATSTPSSYSLGDVDLSLEPTQKDEVSLQDLRRSLHFGGSSESPQPSFSTSESPNSLDTANVNVSDQQSTPGGGFKKSYYLKNFFMILDTVCDKDWHIFTPAERALIKSFKSATEESQRLLVRLYYRKGPWFQVRPLPTDPFAFYSYIYTII